MATDEDKADNGRSKIKHGNEDGDAALLQNKTSHSKPLQTGAYGRSFTGIQISSLRMLLIIQFGLWL